MQEKFYSAEEVVPYRPPLVSLLLSLQPGQAVNFPKERRTSVMATITRLHKSACRFRTVKISETQFAVIREL
ncbi:MAG: hypothetical protein K0B15_07255 [Lentimicrobium sp.]|nr:hypothetical protein [Lentimicrobium sp.]